MTDTPKLGITNVDAGSSQKHVAVNEGWQDLDALVQLGVIDKDLNTPPGSPTAGDTYIVGPAPTGLWATQAGNVAYYNGAWFFHKPNSGWLTYVADESSIYVHNGTSWSIFTLANILAQNGSAGAPTYSFASDTDTGMYRNAANELGFSANGTEVFKVTGTQTVTTSANPLYNNAGSNVTVTYNKNALADDAAFSLQTAFSTRALIGLLGDDSFTIKVSPDGSAFKDAIVADKDTGAVDHTQHPKFSGYCNHDQYNAADAWFRVDINNFRHNDQSSVASGVFTAPHDGYYAFGAGVRHKVNGTPPDFLTIGLSVNGAAPLPDRQTTTGNGGWTIDDNTSVDVTGHIKLSSGNTVELQCYFTNQDGYITADYNYFWGHQVA